MMPFGTMEGLWSVLPQTTFGNVVLRKQVSVVNKDYANVSGLGCYLLMLEHCAELVLPLVWHHIQ